jgi:hypothetical protein
MGERRDGRRWREEGKAGKTHGSHKIVIIIPSIYEGQQM